jgi:hypothetical protein
LPHFTLWLTNSGTLPKNLTLDLGEVEPKEPLTGLLYDMTCRHDYLPLKTVSDGGKRTCTLPPRSMAVLTTLEKADSADLKQPLQLSPERKEPTYHTFDVAGFRRTVALFSFEEPVEWEVWRSSPGKSAFSEAVGEAVHGQQSCSLTYDFVSTKTLGREEHLVATTPINLNAVPLEISLQIRGDGSGHSMSFLFVDDLGETFECPHTVSLTWKGWKKVSQTFVGIPDKWPHWGSNSDGLLDFPIRAFGLIFRERENKYVGQGTVLLDDIRILARPVVIEKE